MLLYYPKDTAGIRTMQSILNWLLWVLDRPTGSLTGVCLTSFLVSTLTLTHHSCKSCGPSAEWAVKATELPNWNHYNFLTYNATQSLTSSSTSNVEETGKDFCSALLSKWLRDPSHTIAETTTYHIRIKSVWVFIEPSWKPPTGQSLTVLQQLSCPILTSEGVSNGMNLSIPLTSHTPVTYHWVPSIGWQVGQDTPLTYVPFQQIPLHHKSWKTGSFLWKTGSLLESWSQKFLVRVYPMISQKKNSHMSCNTWSMGKSLTQVSSAQS